MASGAIAIRIAEPSRADRRTSRLGDGMWRQAGKALIVSRRQRVSYHSDEAAKQNRLRADDGNMRAGEAEQTMRAPGVRGIAVRQFSCALVLVVTENDCGRCLIGVRWEGKSAERNQEALRGHGIGDDDADERPQ